MERILVHTTETVNGWTCPLTVIRDEGAVEYIIREKGPLTETVRHITETVGKKSYPLKITRRLGSQEITVRRLDGARETETFLADAVTIEECPDGISFSVTRAQPPQSPEARAERLRIIREIATKAMIDQGIW